MWSKYFLPPSTHAFRLTLGDSRIRIAAAGNLEDDVVSEEGPRRRSMSAFGNTRSPDEETSSLGEQWPLPTLAPGLRYTADDAWMQVEDELSTPCAAALIFPYKQPFVDWINAADPSPTSHTLTLAEVNQEHTVYRVEVEDEDELAEWLARHHEELFGQELNGWYTDPGATGPKTDRSRCRRSGVLSSSTPSSWTPVRLRSRTKTSKNE